MEKISDIFMDAISTRENTSLAPDERQAKDSLLQNQVIRYTEGEPLCPFIAILQTCNTFVLLFIVPYVPDFPTANEHYAFDLLRVSRLNQTQFIDWYSVDGGIVEPHHKILIP